MPTTESSGLVLELAEEFLERYRKGERPPLREYIDRHPDLADEIREVFPAMAMMERIGIADASMDHDLTAPRPLDPKAAPLTQLGDYRIIREVGRGGMGVVYEAEQLSLGRHVALKVLPGHALLNATYLERFRREAKAAARLHHSNIVPVFGTGDVDGTHFYAMQFIRGEGLDRVLRDLRQIRLQEKHPPSPDKHDPAFDPTATAALGLMSAKHSDPSRTEAIADSEVATQSSVSRFSGSSHSGAEFYRSVAKIGVQIADALSYAHGQGILHRDVKPSNLLLDAQGTAWVTDFGLAKAEGDDLTHTGDIVGTIRYMAPERFEGHSLPQSDIYSLGITLYELLALRPPFDGVHRGRLIEQVLHLPAPRLRKFDPHVPRDLETIILKCTSKNPGDRYASAERLADDLRRFLAGQAIVARPIGALERTWKWIRRNKALAASLVGVAIALLAGTAASVGFALQARHDANRADDEAARATENEAEAKQRAAEAMVAKEQASRSRFVSDMRLIAELRYDSNSSPRAIADRLAEHVPTQPGETDFRDFAWRLYWTELNRSAPHFRLSEVPLAMALNDEGQLVTLGPSGRVQIVDVSTGRQIRSFDSPMSPFKRYAISNNGRTIARGGQRGKEISIMDVDSGEVVQTIRSKNVLHALALSRDGQHLVSVWSDGIAKIHRTKDGNEVAKVKLKNSLLRSLAISDDGKKFVVGNHPGLGQSTIYDHQANAISIEPVAWTIGTAAFSPDGSSVAIGTYSGGLYVVDPATGKHVRSIPVTSNSIISHSFSQDGDRIVIGGTNGLVAIAQPSTGRLQSMRGHTANVNLVAIDGDGKTVVSSDTDGLIRVWDPGRPTAIRRMMDNSGDRVWQTAFDSTGEWMAAAKFNGKVGLFDLSSMSLIREFDPEYERVLGQPEPVPSVALASNRSMIASGNVTSQVTVWNPRTGEILWKSPAISLEKYADRPTLQALNSPVSKRAVSAIAFSPDASLLAIGHGNRHAMLSDYEQEVSVWSTKDWSLVTRLRVRNTVSKLHFTPNSDELLASCHDRCLRTWKRGENRWIAETSFDAKLTSFDLASDGKWIAAGTNNGSLYLLNRDTGKLIHRSTAHVGIISAVSYTRDGHSIATAGRHDNQVRIWDTVSLREVFTHRSELPIFDQQFLPTGDKLISCHYDGLWQFPAVSLEEIDRVHGIGWPTRSNSERGK